MDDLEMPPIPRGDTYPHLNFGELFGEAAAAPFLERLQNYFAQETPIEGLVLNFEKCQWFELLPLARLLALLCGAPNKPTLHLVAPAIEVLPYHGTYIRSLARRIEAEGELLTQTEREQLQLKIKWFGESLPRVHQKAGAFLLGWGVFDLL